MSLVFDNWLKHRNCAAIITESRLSCLSSGNFHRVPAFFQFSFNQLALISLNFNSAILQSASNPTFLLQYFGQGLQFGPGQGEALDDGDRLTAPAFGFPMESYDAIASRGGPVHTAHTICYRALALGAQAARCC